MTRTYPNSGSLNKNERKEKPTHADYRGQATIDGREYWLDAWIKDGPKGKWMSLAFKPKQDAGDVVARVQQGVNQHFGRGDDADTDLPF